MSHSSEAFQQQQEQDQQAQESEYELYYAILDAIDAAKKLGLSEDHIKTLCYSAGIDYSTLEN
jgi:DNA-binding transcriptional regulator YhcF (GntR family)